VCAETAHLGDKFVLARGGVPDLNGQKFARLVIPSAPCSDTRAVSRMLAALRRGAAPAVAGDDDDLWSLARLLTFMVGVTPRAVAFAAASGGGSRLTAQGLAFATAAATSPGLLSPVACIFHDALLERLVAANGGLRTLVRAAEDGTADIHSVVDGSCDWEAAVTPLDWPAVEATWATTAAAHGLPHGRDVGYLARLVSDIADAHRFHLQHDATGARMRLWPVTAAQVAAAGVVPPEHWLEKVRAELQRLAVTAGTIGALADTGS
jgi:hypothetical protein